MTTIEVSQVRGMNWTDGTGKMRPMFRARLKDEPGIFAYGTTRTESVGELLRSNLDRFAVSINYTKPLYPEE